MEGCLSPSWRFYVANKPLRELPQGCFGAAFQAQQDAIGAETWTYAVDEAVRRGNLVPLKREVCGADDTKAHHDDHVARH